jgi:hypothetical protein
VILEEARHDILQAQADIINIPIKMVFTDTMENSGQRNARKNHGQTASPQTQSHPHFRG